MGLRLVWLATLGAGFLLMGAGTASADALDDSILQVKESVKKGDAAKAIAAMKEVAKSDDPRALSLLIGLTDETVDEIALAAYDLAAPKKDAGFLGVLKVRAGNKKLAEASPVRFVAVLKALAVYADKSALSTFEDVFNRYRASNADFSIAAIRGFAAVRSKAVVEDLIKWLLACESTAPYPSSKYQGAAPSRETKENFEKSHEEIVKQLQAMTQQKFTEHKDWKSWWKEAERSFKFPDPPKK